VSVPYCIAAAAVDGQLTHAQFTSERITDPVLRQVLDRTDCVVDPELDPLYPGKFPARVMLTLESGESFSETVLLPRGDPEAPTDETELIEKFRDNCRRAMGAAQVERLRDTIMRLPEAVGPEALCELLTWESI
jgi:2-methylcitrate dehydratase PrpD